MIGRSRRSARLALACVLSAAGFAVLPSAASADVTSVAPADALGILRVANAEATSRKFADFAASIGMAAVQPELADPLGSLLQAGNLTAGFRADGEIGVVILPQAAWENGEPGIVLLLPVSDYAAFLGNFTEITTEGGISAVTMNAEESFVAQWGEYAAIAPVREHVLTPGDGIELNPAAQAAMQENDVVLWGNLPAISAAVGPRMQEAETLFLQGMQAGLTEPEVQKFVPVIRAAAGQMFVGMRTFLADARGATLALTLNEAGINATVTTEFVGDSTVGRLVAGMGAASPGSFTAGLPARSYLMYGGWAIAAEPLVQLLTEAAAPVMAELDRVEGVDTASIRQIKDGLTRSMLAARRTNFGFVAPRGALGTESLVQMVYAIEGDAAGYVSGLAEYSKGYAAVMAPLVGTPAMPMMLEFQPAGSTVDGVTLDVLVMGPNPNPQTPEEAQMAQMMTMMYGPGGLSTKSGMVDQDTAIMTVGAPEALISALIGAARTGEDSLGRSEGPAARTLAQLPSNPSAVMFFAIDELASTVIHYARQFGAPIQVAIPPDLAPIGMAVKVEGPVLHMTTHVPTELIQSLVAAALEAQGGGRGGGGL